MIEWKTPSVEDIPEMRRLIALSGAAGSDASFANIFLLREKYNIKIAFYEDCLLRLYTGNRLPGRRGMTFPLGGDPGKALKILDPLCEDCISKGKEIRFIFLTAEQKELVSKRFPDMVFETAEGNSDYTYTAEHLAYLKGKENEKKRNRVNRFVRRFPDWEIRFFESDAPSGFEQDVIDVEEKWFSMQEERLDSAFLERIEIYEACKNFRSLGLICGLVYVSGIPVAMSIASEISPGIFDINFEKSYGEYAQDGGFSVINKYFAGYLLEKHGAKWINREEDIGLEGLRRAKMAYRPDKLLEKYHTNN